MQSRTPAATTHAHECTMLEACPAKYAQKDTTNTRPGVPTTVAGGEGALHGGAGAVDAPGQDASSKCCCELLRHGAANSEQGDMMDSGFVCPFGPAHHDVVLMLLMHQIKSAGRSHLRQRRQACRRLVSEVDLPPRVTQKIVRGRWEHLAQRFALDLTVSDPDDGEPLDFLFNPIATTRARCRDQATYLLTGSPGCKAFSTWQALSKRKSLTPDAYDRPKIAATLHMDFVSSLYLEQLESGRYFLNVHPLGTSSWSLISIQILMDMPGVQRVHGDQCQYGAEANNQRPVMEPKGSITNSEHVAEALSRTCTPGPGGTCPRPQGGQHQQCNNIPAKIPYKTIENSLQHQQCSRIPTKIHYKSYKIPYKS